MEEYKAETIRAYNKNAEKFSDYFKGLMDIPGRPEFHRFIDILKGERILDLGCGGGDHSLWFKDNKFEVTAVDLSEEMINLAKAKGVDAMIMDIEDLQFDKNSFDGVWAVTSLLHVPKNRMKNVSEKLSEILNPEGILFVVLKKGDNECFIEDTDDTSSRDFLKGAGTKRYFVHYQKDEFLDYMKDYFELVDFWETKPRATAYLHFFFRNKKLS
ncbi:hypothetical protein CO038_01900 [Candidatus Pacearchaeota archaeon CG_4_9_14_0_2_um_filter_39_13]|nr:class I SAM-dependent methyltransferase [Candidatus Pacearchaeota archaeon]OIO43133.1 MAG: hypothetical protein AUJ64_03050 [Candidatus Pacearchaeota archaeon CG1_02_39_14]PJC44701.1 MAG: hypothetical protein CO038_01900 [Candidatus Pacearchaeota archaeon CG_4_9_14_0_2_um_filter_39_13]